MKLMASVDNGHHYRLLRLTPDLEEALNDGTLVFKSSTISREPILVGCTANKTYQLRQMNQSNTLLLTRPYNHDGDDKEKMEVDKASSLASQLDHEMKPCTPSSLIAFGAAHNFIEPVEMASSTLESLEIPLYHGGGKISRAPVKMSLDDLRMTAPMSDAQFNAQWRMAGGLESSGIACMPADEFSQQVLDEFLNECTVKRPREWFKTQVSDLFNSVKCDVDEPDHVQLAVVLKFVAENGILDAHKIAQFYGHRTLCSLKSEVFPLTDFLSKWSHTIPVEVPFELTLDMLAGLHYCPTPTSIKYFDEKNLSTNPKIRFKQLFSAKGTWELEDMLPFIEPVRFNKVIKLDNFIMKFAKRRKLGTRTVISER